MIFNNLIIIKINDININKQQRYYNNNSLTKFFHNIILPYLPKTSVIGM